MQNDVKTNYHWEDNKLVVDRSQDVQDILDFNKERNIDGHNRKSDMRLVGSIPFVVIEMWMKECGAKLGSKEFQEYVKKKLTSGYLMQLKVVEISKQEEQKMFLHHTTL